LLGDLNGVARKVKIMLKTVKAGNAKKVFRQPAHFCFASKGEMKDEEKRTNNPGSYASWEKKQKAK